MKEIEEIKVYCEYENQKELIGWLYKKVLIKDDKFYYLYEPGYLVIRTTRRFIRKIEEFIDFNYDYDYHSQTWIEWSEDVIKCKNEFAMAMHGICVMELEGKSSYNMYERITHCMFNVTQDTMHTEMNLTVWTNFEAFVLAKLVLGRAYSEGFYYGQTTKNVNLAKYGLAEDKGEQK